MGGEVREEGKTRGWVCEEVDREGRREKFGRKGRGS